MTRIKINNVADLAERFDRTTIPNNLCYRELRRTIINEVIRQYPDLNRNATKEVTDEIIERYAQK